MGDQPTALELERRIPWRDRRVLYLGLGGVAFGFFAGIGDVPRPVTACLLGAGTGAFLGLFCAYKPRSWIRVVVAVVLLPILYMILQLVGWVGWGLYRILFSGAHW